MKTFAKNIHASILQDLGARPIYRSLSVCGNLVLKLLKFDFSHIWMSGSMKRVLLMKRREVIKV